jgi:transposase
MWLKNRVNWTEKETQKWESMALERCVTGMAYEMRLVLQGIYQWKDVGEARKLLGNWCAWVQAMRERTGELLEPMDRAARMIEGHLEGILAHWTQGLTTAFMEGLNSLKHFNPHGSYLVDWKYHMLFGTWSVLASIKAWFRGYRKVRPF